MSSITLKNIGKSYGKGSPKAVDDLSINIKQGDFLCLLGPSGCGKTTTLRILAGLEHPTEGEIAMDGKTIVSTSSGIFVPAEKRGLGLVFQSYALWPHLTVTENIAFGLKLQKIDKTEREARIADVTEKLSIAQYRNRYPNQLSGGQQQRVALARMLALNPSVILLDEPLSNLDAKLRLEMRAELRRIHTELGATIVFVTHDQWEAMTLATKIVVMSDGRLQQLGTPDDIYQRPANRFVAEFVGSLPINIIDLDDGSTDPLSLWMRGILTRDGGTAQSVGLRPESVQIAPAGRSLASATTRPAVIKDILPTGGSWIVDLSVDGEKIFAIAGSAPRHTVGETVEVSVDPTELHLFDAQGKRINPSHKH
ncbi:ABC transporter ATP-binding protein [Nitratireductor aquimarinus]|uniref:ABC transporter ATP-binding protein n=1 Tax=Nitratireductor TaxID=245876 RepID=UPI0019D33FC0|nr:MULTISPECIES: ABC transporter ATP-binding protein [Nitratireductor]MBN7778503.1 ABC transporter ATP-binding protein [Nitratireductor pacificus]MBN7782825.1 ABC transporter ATP-binding protein [Nitratireductor pacificus]MBN7791632.1 ABC transporter ATP-binding protein [Nitratireductor aquimarinus]MBY6100890.1 ABC transporter ATP-binding protein [Nitratireductor aquimarinus]MCA1260832.1 ABC transporter ATP-binding protein [Nitratireductor aquimarinus]